MTQQDDSIQIVPDPDKLDRYHRQQLSAMLDGELSPDQARFMLRRLQHDVELAGCWERWQVCGDVLRGQRNALLPADFAGKVSAAIAADGMGVPEARNRSTGPRLLRWGGGAALAASVAMAALLVGRQAGIEPDRAPAQAVPAWAASEESTPAIPEPAPVPSTAAEGTVALAGAALAAAEAPRRSAERRAQDRAGAAAAGDSAGSSVRGRADAGPLVAAATTDSAAESPAPAPEPVLEGVATAVASLQPTRAGIGADPFQSLPMTAASRPWPRAAGAGAVGDYTVGFGNAVLAAPGWPAGAAPRRPEVAELFGLPAEAGPRLPVATAIGARAISAGDAQPLPTALFPGPR